MKILIIYIFISAFLILSGTQSYSNINANNNSSDSAEYCIVSGEKIEGEGVTYRYLNKEVKFCCNGCEISFKKNPAKYLKGAGLRCPVCDDDDGVKDINLTEDGVKYYFCNEGCKGKFGNDPESYLENYKK
ncbi:MAG: TRASH domain-containing protein [Bacteroidetes bacterium]|nr:TRASH domain-containing protein [Bacteroidota bacterium]